MTSSNTSLAPDTDDSKQTLADNVNANATVTAYAHAILNVQINPIPDLATQPDWYDTMQDNLKIAQTHATNWIENLGPDLFSTVPQSIINYNTTFLNATNDILKIISDSNGSPTDAQKNQIIQLLQATLEKLQQQQTAIKSAQTNLKTFSDEIIKDHTNLLDGKNGATEALQDDQAQVVTIQNKINELNTKLSNDQTKATVAEIGIGVGIFLAVAGFALAVATGGAALPLVVGAIGVIATGAAIVGTVVWSIDVSNDLSDIQKEQSLLSNESAQVSALQTIISTADGLVSQNESAQTAISDILDMYSTLEAKMTSVITDLQSAQNDEVGGILQELDIQSAQTAWGQLNDYAQMIENLAITNQGNVDAPQTIASA